MTVTNTGRPRRRRSGPALRRRPGGQRDPTDDPADRLRPGAAGGRESATVTFEVHTDRLSFTGRDLGRIVEPGEITFRVGTAGDTFAGPVSVRLVGETRTITGNRVMDTPTRVALTAPP